MTKKQTDILEEFDNLISEIDRDVAGPLMQLESLLDQYQALLAHKACFGIRRRAMFAKVNMILEVLQNHEKIYKTGIFSRL